MSDLHPILVPLHNVNDETVILLEWLIAHGERVRVGDLLCVVETSKAAVELEAQQEGILYHLTKAGSQVSVGADVGFIGTSLEVVENHLREGKTAAAVNLHAKGTKVVPAASKRAQMLAEEHGIPLEHVAATGVVGTIKEADIMRYLSQHSPIKEPGQLKQFDEPTLPQPLLDRVISTGELSKHESFIAQSLQQTLRRIVFATIDSDVELTAANKQIHDLQSQGTLVSLLHVFLYALGRALPRFQRLISFRHNNQLYRYRNLDIAFVVRNLDGLLFTPVVRALDTLTLVDLAKECQRLSLRVMRGRTKPEDLEGACFTVSHVATPGIGRFTALPNRFQSSILAVPAERHELQLAADGSVKAISVITLTLSYDHALCDATYAADFLARVREEIQSITV